MEACNRHYGTTTLAEEQSALSIAHRRIVCDPRTCANLVEAQLSCQGNNESARVVTRSKPILRILENHQLIRYAAELLSGKQITCRIRLALC
jgi:hypothetical protein